MNSYNFMTPETEGRTRYYWFQTRNIRPDDADLSQMMSDDVKHAFEEDREVLNEVQKGMTHKKTPHIDLPIDGGQLRFRRQLEGDDRTRAHRGCRTCLARRTARFQRE